MDIGASELEWKRGDKAHIYTEKPEWIIWLIWAIVGQLHGQNDLKIMWKSHFVRVVTHYGSNESNDHSGFSVVGLYKSRVKITSKADMLMCWVTFQARGDHKTRGAGALVFEVGYHPRKSTSHVIRVVFQDQEMYARTSFRCAKTCKIEEKKKKKKKKKKKCFLVILTNFGKDMTES